MSNTNGSTPAPYTVTVGMPGYLPDVSYPSDSLDDARMSLIGELWITAERTDIEAVAIEDLINEANRMPAEGGRIDLADYCHEIHPNPNGS